MKEGHNKRIAILVGLAFVGLILLESVELKYALGYWFVIFLFELRSISYHNRYGEIMDKIWYNHIRYQIKAIRNKLGVSDAEVDKLEKEEDKKYPGAENTRDKEMDEIFN